MLLFLLRTTTVRYLFSVEHFRLFYELAGIFDDEDVAPKSSVQTHPKSLSHHPKISPMCFLFFLFDIIWKENEKRDPKNHEKRCQKIVVVFWGGGEDRRQKTRTSSKGKKDRRKISIFLRFWSHLRAYSKHHVHVHTRHDRVCFNALGYQSAPTPTRHQQEIELGRSIIIRAR